MRLQGFQALREKVLRKEYKAPSRYRAAICFISTADLFGLLGLQHPWTLKRQPQTRNPRPQPQAQEAPMNLQAMYVVSRIQEGLVLWCER